MVRGGRGEVAVPGVIISEDVDELLLKFHSIIKTLNLIMINKISVHLKQINYKTELWGSFYVLQLIRIKLDSVWFYWFNLFFILLQKCLSIFHTYINKNKKVDIKFSAHDACFRNNLHQVRSKEHIFITRLHLEIKCTYELTAF